jgi:hypothetical protein
MTWLSRLKIVDVCHPPRYETYETPAEVGGFVGFVAYTPTHIQKTEANSDVWCWPYSDALNTAEIETFTRWVEQFIADGLAVADAEARADNLVLLDREAGGRPSVASGQKEAESPAVLRRRAADAARNAWHELAAVYHAHHVGCAQCTAAGRGMRYGLRCALGEALWREYCLHPP